MNKEIDLKLKIVDNKKRALKKCKDCGSKAFGDWVDNSFDFIDSSLDFQSQPAPTYTIECTNAINCPSWTRVFANTQDQAVEAWNKIND